MQNEELVVLLAEDDAGVGRLVTKNLKRAGLGNPIFCFKDGLEILDFLYKRGPEPHRQDHASYILLLDIRMPRADGVEVLRQLKQDPELHNLPVIMLTTTDDPREVQNCYALGCNNYIAKPVEYDDFVVCIRQLGYFLSVVKVPQINHSENPDSEIPAVTRDKSYVETQAEVSFNS